jgi:integrase/recombinase XerD
MIDKKIIDEINNIIDVEPKSKKFIYQTLLSKRIMQPNSDRLFEEIIKYGTESNLINYSKIKRFQKKRNKLPNVFSKEQLKEMFDSIHSPKLAVICFVSFFCGLRISEITKLKTMDIDLNKKKLKVRDSKNPNRTKNDGYGKDRYVEIPDIAISPIKKWIYIIGESSEWFIPSMQSPDRSIKTKTIHEQFRGIMKRANLNQIDYSVEYKVKNRNKMKKITKNIYQYKFHSLRHTFASYLRENKVPIETIQQILGHESIDTTMIYAKITDKKRRELINTAFNKTENIIYKPNLEQIKEQELRSNSALDILNKRFAIGEIDVATYKVMKNALK